MGTTIKIKRSLANGAPGSLADGELAYSGLAGNVSNGGDRLYIGIGGAVTTIGGKYFTTMLDHTPGTLTTSSAVIVDADGKIDMLKVDNIQLDGNTISTLDSNGNLVLAPNGSGKVSFYNLYTFPASTGTNGYALVSDGAGNVTWSSVSAATTATNLAGGTAGQVPYQTAAGATSFYGPGTSGQILVSGGTSAPTYTNTGSIQVGTADKADKWTYARTLTLAGDLSGSVEFDGSSNFTLTATVTANNIELGTDTTGNYIATGATSGHGISGSASSEGATFTVTVNSTSSNTVNTIVYRDPSGNFAAGTITANLTGVATTATNLAGGEAGVVAYQTGAGATGFTAVGTAGTVLVSNGTSAPTWNNSLALASTTAATSTTTGALTVAGGVGIQGSLYVGGEIVAEKLTIQYTTVTTTLVVTDDIIRTTNTTAATSTTTGALQIAGGAGIGGDLYVGGTIYGTINGTITTATNLSAGTAGQLVYQSAPGVTAYAGPGTSGQILVSGGTGAPTYTTTSSIQVGTADKADKWTYARTLTLAGDLGGSVTFDGSGDFTLTATVQANSVALGTDTTGDYVATGATSGHGISGSTTGENQTFTVTVNSTSTNSANTIVYRDASGNFAAGTVTANLTGTATTATNLAAGSANQIPYQTAAGATSFLATGSFGQVLQVVNTATGAFAWGDIDGGTY